MLADVRCFFSGFSSPLPTPLVSTGVGEVWETRDFEIFSFYHWLTPYWLERLQSTSDCVQCLLVPFLRGLGPPAPFLGKKALCFAKGERPEGVAGEEGGCGQPA